ncbi:DUF4077 domain-containing protein [Brevibacillus fluminis]|uniref:DUF4077 domain-containing protein n=1 Tax=Brevibacillus fluminis TaxID=511487 RepID=UPI003F8B26E6
MFNWIKAKCLSNLEQESQRNNLFLFLLIIAIILGEANILLNVPFFNDENIYFLFAATIGISLGIICNLLVTTYFKYIMMFFMFLFTVLHLYLFSPYPAVFQMFYFYLAISLIYLNSRLILFFGSLTVVFTFVGHLFWKEIFFPWSDFKYVNIPLGLFIETTLVLWAITKIGTSYNLIENSNHQMKKLLKENEEQLELIERQNKVLEQYVNQIEQLILQEERNRMAKELHDTIGHTITSLIIGMEATKNVVFTDSSKSLATLDHLIETARNCLDEMRQNVYQISIQNNRENLEEQIEGILQEFRQNTGTEVRVRSFGDRYEMGQQVNFVFVRCLQESLTNALRHGHATSIDISLFYQSENVKLIIQDNGSGFDEENIGFGLRTMQERVESIQGKLTISSEQGRGTSIIVHIPRQRYLAKNEISVLIVDDHEFIRESFQIQLSLENDVDVVGVASNGSEAVQLCEEMQPNVVLIDIHMPGMDGVEATKIIKQKWPHIRVIILTTFHEVQYAVEAINAGAEGYLMKSTNPKNIANAIRLVYNGGDLISQEMAKLLISEIRLKENQKNDFADEALIDTKKFNLKEREVQILKCLTQGVKYKEIAIRLNLSEGTVRNYISAIYSKLEVRGRQEATRVAKENRII